MFVRSLARMPNTKTPIPYEILNSIFKKKLEKNPKYSLRAFARDLNISAGRLSVILSGKEEPGERFLKSILTNSKLTPAEKDQIINSQRVRIGLDEETTLDDVDLSNNKHEDLAHMEAHAILSLLRTGDATDDHDWIAQRLGITKKAVDTAVAALLKYKVIVHKKNKYIQKVSGLVYHEENLKPQKIAAQYRDYLYETIPGLLDLDREHSIFATLVVPLDKQDIIKAKKILQTAFKRIKLLSNKSERTEVYNISIVGQKMTK